ncbi:MAG TPA: BON domain-containing protein [Pyrinomonadaceae bacterium]|nr:BON domain-containing protein [Pyrinomonadaceae bacterium]
MKFKFLVLLSLSAFLLLSGCRGGDDANVNKVNANMNTNMVVNTGTPAPVNDAATKATVEAALKKAGFNDVTVEATTTNIILRGTVAKDKMAEAVRIAQEEGKKPVKNELTEKY